MKLEDYLASMFDDLGIEHFGPREFFVGSRPPPVEIWSHILPTALLLEDIRVASGHPLHINSGYRDPSYNASVGGAADSQHLHFRACDVRSDIWTPEQVHAYVESRPDREYYGMGIYQTFVHLDCRHVPGFNRLALGSPARWDER